MRYKPRLGEFEPPNANICCEMRKRNEDLCTRRRTIVLINDSLHRYIIMTKVNFNTGTYNQRTILYTNRENAQRCKN